MTADQDNAPTPDDSVEGAETQAGIWVEIDQDTCIGSGTCARLAKGAFALGEDGVAHIVDADAAEEKRLRLAERSCPTGAIIVDSGD